MILKYAMNHARLVACCIGVAHSLLLLYLVFNMYITVDEPMNVAAGLSYWNTGEFHIYRVNPPLAKMIAVIPTLMARPNVNFESVRDDPSRQVEFQAGRLFSELNRRRLLELVRLSRLAGIGWSLIGAYIVYRWSRELFGESAGILSLILWCFDPYILGSAPLVMTDVPASVICMNASYVFWCYMRKPSTPQAVHAGIMLGIALLVKFTLLILCIAWPVLIAADYLLSPRKNQNHRRMRLFFVTLYQCCIITAVSIFTINCGYAFSGTGKSLGNYSFVSSVLTGTNVQTSANRFRDSWIGALPVPLPEDFVRGIDVQKLDFERGLPSYLAGEWRHHGWVYYYLYSLAVKLPIGTIALMTMGVFLSFMHIIRNKYIDSCVLIFVPIAIIILLSVNSGYTNHSRYAIPMLPFLMVNAGRVVDDARRMRNIWMTTVVYALALITVASSMYVYPYSFSYFNEIAGGPFRGPDHLLGSNIDWGQDLLALKRWLDQNPDAQPIGLAYYNFVDPLYCGINYYIPPTGPNGLFVTDKEYQSRFGPKPGYYAISVNYLRGAICEAPAGSKNLVSWCDYRYFNTLQPIAYIGYSIYIYYIDKEQANAVRQVIGIPLLR